MKKNLLFVIVALLASYASAQNSNPWPTTGNVGIGTTSPTAPLEVKKNFIGLLMGNQINTLATFTSDVSNSVPAFSESVKIINYYNSTSLPGGKYSKIQAYNGTTAKGYLQFGTNVVSPSPTPLAVTLGYDSTHFIQIQTNGKVNIGDVPSTPDGYKLFVDQGILTEKVKVALKTTADWADYVFAPDYSLMPLKEVETYIKENQHLPNVPSAQQMVDYGLDVAKTDAMLMQKVEELTLYIIDQQKQIAEQQKLLTQQQQLFTEQQKVINGLIDRLDNIKDNK